MLQSQNVKVIGLFYWHYLCHATKLQMGVFCCIYTVGENTNRQLRTEHNITIDILLLPYFYESLLPLVFFVIHQLDFHTCRVSHNDYSSKKSLLLGGNFDVKMKFFKKQVYFDDERPTRPIIILKVFAIISHYG